MSLQAVIVFAAVSGNFNSKSEILKVLSLFTWDDGKEFQHNP